MANRTLALTYLAVVVVSGGLSLGCDKGPGDIKPSPPQPPAGLAVTALAPTSGSIYGPTTVTIAGSGFDDHAIVILDGGHVSPIRMDSTTISFIAPARAAGQVPVVVANGNGQTVSAPAFTYRAAPVHAFTAATGFSTSDLRDAHDRIVRVDSDGYFIWAENGTAVKALSAVDGIFIIIDADHVCGCTLEVRFGIDGGERRAYVTADYGHENPGTVVALALTGSGVRVTPSSRYPPGTYTLSGTVTEVTPAGPIPLEGVPVYLGIGSGWREGFTDRNGLYEIRGLYNGDALLEIRTLSYQTARTNVSINGDTRFDLQLARR